MEEKNYELVIVIPAGKEGKKVKDAVKAALSKDGAKRIKTESWGVKEFAYPIEKASKGSYWIYSFAASSFSTDKLNIFLNREKQIYRYLLLRK